ncbi:MAG: PAS domain S-box protein [Marivibrio sp.]|uniref:PAS domain S-box protein n=1 Tax=Marivibrio sp. TaxID=2039719 RepID=UPI0032EAFE88
MSTLDDIRTLITDSDPKKPLHVGQVMNLGLDALKARLGEARWRKAADFIDRQLHAALQSELDADDRYMRSRDGSYVIVFSSPDPLQATAKAIRIADMVNKRLFGEEGVDGVEVAGFVASDEGLAPGETRKPGDLIADLAERARTHMLSAERGERSAPSGERSETERAMPDSGPARGFADGFDPAEMFEAIRLEGEARVGVGYLPIYDLKREAVDRFLCLPVRQDPLTSTQYLAYEALPMGGGDEALLALDMTAFETALREHAECLGRGLSMRTGVNIHFETLSTKRCRERIMSLLRQAPASLQRTLVPVIHGVPAGVTDTRVQDLFAPLLQVMSEVAVSLDPRDYRARLPAHILKLAGHGITRVILTFPETLEPGDQSWLTAVQHGGFWKSVTFTAGNVCTPAVAQRLKELGVSYAFGPLFGGPYTRHVRPYAAAFSEFERPGACALAYAKVAAFEKARMQAIADHFNVTFAVTKPNAAGEPCFYYLSPNSEELTGYARDELIGEPVKRLQCDETDRRRAAAFFQRLKRCGEASVVLANRRKDGAAFSNRITATAPPASHHAPRETFYAFLEGEPSGEPPHTPASERAEPV